MCGIAGLVSAQSGRRCHALEQMIKSLRHRGPDGEGIHEFSNCALGHTRLKIVDLVNGDQPMVSAQGDVAVTFNGEIYGYRNLRKALGDYHFRTTSDTEVILALYQKYGRNLTLHLPGMFAFGLWDESRQVLFAARDRFGEKPFYYAWGQSGEFIFASEIKSLIASGLFKPKINKAAVAHYLRRLYVHPHETIYSNIFVLPPAHCLYLRDGQLSTDRYWQFPQTKEPLSEQDAVDEFRRLFEQAVERQLIADVPVGAFLSGGLDSSSVVAAASSKSRHLKTYSFGFLDGVNELPYAREIAQLYGTEHVEIQDGHLDVADLLGTMAQVYDEPFADSSNIPTYVICRAASRYGRVILTGDGGDELLAGYDFWYRPLWQMEESRSYLDSTIWLLRLAARGIARLGLPEAGKWKQVISGTNMRARYHSIVEAHMAHNRFFTDDELAELGMDGAAGEPVTLEGAGAFTDTIDDALRIDLSNYMPGDILVKTDRASMAHGLELRAPFLDVDFASFCISLPSRLKINAEQDKWLLRRCFSEAWTSAIRERQKCGFGAPVSRWLKRAGVVRLKERVLKDPDHSLFSLIPFEASRRFVAEDNYQTWILLTLGLWLENGREQYL